MCKGTDGLAKITKSLLAQVEELKGETKGNRAEIEKLKDEIKGTNNLVEELQDIIKLLQLAIVFLLDR